MSEVGDWVGELTTTIGVGDVALGGAISSQFATFADVGMSTPWYVILDGDDRETGVGTIIGSTLQRTTVHATLVGGVYSDNSPGAINLSGAATVHSTFSKTAFDLINAALVKLSGIDTGATDDQIASEVPSTPVGNVSATDVQAAIAELDIAITAVGGGIFGSNNVWTGINDFNNNVDFNATADFNGTADFTDATVLGLVAGVDESANYNWTGTHSYTTNFTINGNDNLHQGNIAEAVVAPITEAGVSRTLALADRGATVYFSNVAAITVTVPLNSTVAFPIGTTIALSPENTGQITIAPEGAVVIQSEGGLLSSRAQHTGLTLQKKATDTWWLTGGLA